jgi:hypothetical protein
VMGYLDDLGWTGVCEELAGCYALKIY